MTSLSCLLRSTNRRVLSSVKILYPVHNHFNLPKSNLGTYACNRPTVHNPHSNIFTAWNKQLSPKNYCTSLNPENFEDIPPKLVIEGTRSFDLEKQEDGIILNYGEYKLDLPFVWLRDHCRCNHCYNKDTNQKNIENYMLCTDIKPEHIDYNGNTLCTKWKDGHISCYNLEWLLENTFHPFHKERVTKKLWNNEMLNKEPLPTVEYKHFMESDKGLKAHLSNLLEFGFSIVTETPATHEGTVEVSERLCFLQETHFGRSWTFTADMARLDTAYTNIPLGAHTDNTYFTTPSGIQVFHVLEHDGEGGETLLVDGFHAAEKLQQKDSNAYNFLATKIIPHEYFEPEVKIRSLGTVLSLHPTTGRLMHIRYNPYDRSPLFTLTADDTKLFYKHYGNLKQEVENKDNEFWVKLRPGMVLFVDNWRVMHGRAGFTGKRRVSGCYLSRDDWTSKARVFGLVSI